MAVGHFINSIHFHMSKRQNIEIADDTKQRVSLVTTIRGITLREASNEAWAAWLAKNEASAIQKVQKASRSNRRAVSA